MLETIIKTKSKKILIYYNSLYSLYTKNTNKFLKVHINLIFQAKKIVSISNEKINKRKLQEPLQSNFNITHHFYSDLINIEPLVTK